MKKLLLGVTMLLIAVIANAQTDITKFLGIPVDGTKAEILSKLREKGFKSSYTMGADCLEGVFNGIDVYVSPVTNGSKVYRIGVIYKNSLDEQQIKRHFNRLCQQFANNSKYQAVANNQEIPESEDISYKITVNKKRYEAGFIQLPYNKNKLVWFTITENGYDKYSIAIFYDNGYNQANGEDL